MGPEKEKCTPPPPHHHHPHPQLAITCDKFYLHLPFFYAIDDITSLRDSQKEMIVHIKSATPLYVKYQQQQHMGWSMHDCVTFTDEKHVSWHSFPSSMYLSLGVLIVHHNKRFILLVKSYACV